MILVTGGTGLVGSHVLYKLTKNGLRVRAFIRPGASRMLVHKVFGFYSSDPETLLNRIEWCEGDILDVTSLENAMQGITQVFHCAAMVSFNPSDKPAMLMTNVQGTINVVNQCLISGVEKLCHVSSIATLGSDPDQEFTDEGEPWKDIPKSSAYAESKYLAEREVWRAMAEGLNAVIVNPSVILGPGNWNSGSSELFSIVWKGMNFYTEGINGYVDVNDVAGAMVALMDSNLHGSRYILNGGNHSYREILSLIAKGLGKTPPAINITPFLAEIAWRMYAAKGFVTGVKPAITKETARSSQKTYKYTSQKITRDLNYHFTPIEQCIAQTCSAFLKDSTKTVF